MGGAKNREYGTQHVLSKLSSALSLSSSSLLKTHKVQHHIFITCKDPPPFLSLFFTVLVLEDLLQAKEDFFSVGVGSPMDLHKP